MHIFSVYILSLYTTSTTISKHTPVTLQAGIVAVNVFFFVRIMREGGGGGPGGGKGSGYASFPEGGSADDGSDREGGGPNYQPPEY